MNTLSNGAIAVGAPGSIMRLLSAYEYELRKEYESGNIFYKEDLIPKVARDMIAAASMKRANIGPAFKRAAIAVGIRKPTVNSVWIYIQASGFKGE